MHFVISERRWILWLPTVRIAHIYFENDFISITTIYDGIAEKA